MDAFNIRGTCRLVAYELLSYWKPGGQVFPLVQTIADGLGLSNEELRTHFNVEDRPGRMWRFTIPAPMMAVVDPRPNRPDPPAKSAGVPSDLPSKTPERHPWHCLIILRLSRAGTKLKCRREVVSTAPGQL